MITIDGTRIYEYGRGGYKERVVEGLTIGDVIRRARKRKKWNQEKLGEEAERFKIRGNETKINKATVSKVESEPYTSEFGTVYRLLMAVGLSFADVERAIGSPFKPEAAPEQHHKETRASASAREEFQPAATRKGARAQTSR